ncbi:hypothetical protein GGF37_002727 [Kickxella alabastrina]|nr:hypothetical protein GGF37_002727 [Kickxella alabastrina]
MIPFCALRRAAFLQRGFSTLSARLLPYPYSINFVPEPSKVSIAVTFAASPDLTTGTCKIVGWVQQQPTTDSPTIDGQYIRPQEFAENAEFWPQVDRILEKHAHEDPELQAQAAGIKSGWLNITDGRNPPPPSRTGAAEDIFGSVMVEDRIIKPGSFQANWAHRPVTIYGLFQLPEYLHNKLVESLSKKNDE